MGVRFCRSVWLALPQLVLAAVAAAAADPMVELPEVTVTASRMSALAGDLPAPLVHFSAAELSRTAASNLSEFLRDLPLNGGGSFDQQNVVGTAPGTTAVSLRGLGPAHTLILLNGRRLVPFGLAHEYSQGFVDVSAIPLGLLRAVEIGLAGNSAIHGSDATAGVINLITVNAVDHPRVALRIGGYAGGRSRGLDLANGFRTGPWQGVAAGGWSRQDGILQGERPFSASANQALRGGQDKRSQLGPYPSTVVSQASPWPSLSVPVGPYSRSDLLGNPSTGQNAFDYNPHLSLIPDQERGYGYARATRPLGSALQVTVELLASHARTRVFSAPPSTAMTGPLPVPTSNPYNPLGVPGLVFLRILEGPPRHDVTHSLLLRGLVGLDGALPAGWSWRSGILPMRSEATVTTRNEVRRDLLLAALAATDPARAYNPFGAWTGGPFGGADHNATLIHELLTDTRRKGTSDLILADLSATGPLPWLQRGESSTQLALGVEAWRERFTTHEDPLALAGKTLAPAGVGIDGARTGVAGFAEVLAPLLPALDLQLAGRAEHFSDFGTTVNPHATLLLRPTAALRLRAGSGTGFRAPGLPQRFAGTLSYPQGLYDPVTGRDIRPTVVIGGNPDLQAETSRTSFLGAEADLVRGESLRLTAGLDWTRLQVDDVIIADAQYILDHEAAFPGAVVRDVFGQVVRVTSLYRNLTARRVEVLDLKGTLTHLGPADQRWTARLQASWLHRWREQGTPAGTWLELAGRTNSAGRSYPQWRGQFTVERSLPRGFVAATLHAVSRYRSLYPTGSSGQTVTVGAWTSLDLQAGINLGRHSRLTLGVRNLSNRQPPFADTSPGYDWAVHEAHGRRVHLQFSTTLP